MSNRTPVAPSSSLNNVRYEIRGELAHRAEVLERAGCEIIKLNVGNPGHFGLPVPEAIRMAVVENLHRADAYCHQKGIFPAREAVVMQFQRRGITGVTAEHVIMGNGVSELIDICLRALLEDGDEVLLPSPDYPLWSASTVLNGGRPVYYHCRPEQRFMPDPEELEKLISERTRALVLINPNNPTGAVYPAELLESIVRLAEDNGLVLFADEIYDQVLYDGARHQPLAPLVNNTVCISFGGLSKVYRACGYRVGWAVFTGPPGMADQYVHSAELLASLRLCGNVPGQWGVQTALGGIQSIHQLTAEDGRLGESRAAVISSITQSRYLQLVVPMGAMYAFPSVDTGLLPEFDDHRFALDLLNQQHVLVVPGSSFNTGYRDHFRITLLPEAHIIKDVFERIESVLNSYAAI